MSIIFHLIRFTRVHPRLQIPLLSVVLESLVEITDRKAVVHDLAGVLQRHGKKFPQILVLWLLLDVLLLPGVDVLAVPHQDVEIGVQQKNHTLPQLVQVQLDRHRLLLPRRVAQQRRLDHHHAVSNRLTRHAGLEVYRLVRRGSEGVDEGRPSEMVDKLGEMLERGGEAEGAPVIFVEKRKSHTELEQQPVHPLLDLESVLNFSLFGDHPRQHHRRRLLVKPFPQLGYLIFPQVVQADRRDSGSDDIIRPFVCDYRLNVRTLNHEKITLSLFSDAAASAWLKMKHRAELAEMPPKYQLLVPPSPTSISAACFKVFSFKDFAVPNTPLTLSSLLKRSERWQERGKSKSPY